MGNASTVNWKTGVTDSVIVITHDWKEIRPNLTSVIAFHSII